MVKYAVMTVKEESEMNDGDIYFENEQIDTLISILNAMSIIRKAFKDKSTTDKLKALEYSFERIKREFESI